MPGIGSTWTPFWNCAVRPDVVGIVRLAEVLAVTADSVCDVAVTVKFKEPAVAKLTALVVIGTTCDAPAARVTVVEPRLAASAAGPASARLKMSETLPVFVTVSSKVVPGAPAVAFSETLTPLARTLSVPLATAVTVDAVDDADAVTVNGRLPVAVPACGVRVSVTSRKLLAPGGTVMSDWLSAVATPASPVTPRATVSSAVPVLVI